MQALRVQPRQQRAAARLITCWRRRAERPGQTAAPTKTCRDSQAQKQIEGLTGKRCVKDTGRVDVDVPAPPAGLFTLDSCRLPAAVRKCQRHSLRRLCLCSASRPGSKTCDDDNGLITVETPLREVPDHPCDSSGTQTLTFSCHQAGPLPFRP